MPTIYFAPAKPDLRGVETRQGDYVINQLADRMNRNDLVGDIISHWHKLAQRRRTLVFCVDVAHSLHVKDEFIKSGVRAEHLDGATPKIERDAILERLEAGETEVICNCMVLTEGVDLPAIGCIVLGRPTKQIGLFRQMAGRGLRPAPGKTNLILIDHSGAVYRHGLLEDQIEWTVSTDSRAHNSAHEARDRQTTSRLIECTQCGAVRQGGEVCSHCGFLPKRRPDAMGFRDGDLHEVGQQQQAHSVAEQQRWYRELMALRTVRNTVRPGQGKEPLKPTWPAAKFKDKFGTWPPFAWNNLAPASEVSAEISSWVRSRDIAYAKGQRSTTWR